MFVAVRVDHLQRELHAAVGLAFLELEPYAVDLTGFGVVELEPCRRGAVAGHPCGRLAVHQRAGVLGRVLGGRRRDGGRGGDVHAFDGVAGLLQQFEFGERRPCGATDRPRELHGDVFDLLAKIRRIHLIEGALVLRLVDQCPLGTVSEPRDDPELEQAAGRLEHEPHAVHTLRRRQVDPIPVRVGPVADPQRTVVAVVAVRRGPLAGAGACGAAERQVRVLGLRLRGSPRRTARGRCRSGPARSSNATSNAPWEPSMSAATSFLELTASASLRPISTHPEPFQTSIS